VISETDLEVVTRIYMSLPQQRTMLDRREIMISLGGMVAIAGCTSSDQQPDTETPTDSNQTSGNDTEPESPDTDEPPTPSINITKISAPETAQQAERFDVTATITADVATTITGEAIAVNGETVAEESVEIDSDGEQTATLSLVVGSQAPTGNGTIRVRAINGSVTQEASTDIEIVRIPPDWKDPFDEAKAKLEQFLDTYAAVGSESDDATILDTTISDGYSGEGNPLLYDADNLAGEALEEVNRGTDAGQRITRLRDEVDFLNELYDLQSETCTIFPLLETELERFRNDRDRTFNVDDKYQTVSKTHQQVSDTLDGTNPVVGSNYEAKLDQIEAELEIVDLMITAIVAVFSARNNFNAEFYGTAFDRAQSARRDFGLAVRDIDDEGAYPPNDAIDTAFRDHAEAWQAEASKIENEAAGRETEDDSQ
jgi:hypothetical protein